MEIESARLDAFEYCPVCERLDVGALIDFELGVPLAEPPIRVARDFPADRPAEDPL